MRSHIQDFLYVEEFNAIVAAETRALVVPPRIKRHGVGIAFARVNNKAAVTLAEFAVMDAIRGIGHHIHAVVANQPESFAGRLSVERLSGAGGADFFDQFLEVVPGKVQFHVCRSFR